MLVHGSHWRKEARLLVLAAGAWSGLIPELLPCPCGPVRGQMLLLGGVDWPWGGSVRQGQLYAVRRGATGLLVGATVEEAGFDKHTTVEGIEDLLAFARRLFPGIGKTRLETVWAGLRPGTPDGLPILGPPPGLARDRRHRPFPQRHPARPLDGAAGGASGTSGEAATRSRPSPRPASWAAPQDIIPASEAGNPPAISDRPKEGPGMTHIITEPCIGVKDTACVDVCPVDCIYGKDEDWEMLYIHPEECIDCGLCVDACPVEAIYPLEEVPGQVEGVHRQELRALRHDPSVTPAPPPPGQGKARLSVRLCRFPTIPDPAPCYLLDCAIDYGGGMDIEERRDPWTGPHHLHDPAAYGARAGVGWVLSTRPRDAVERLVALEFYSEPEGEVPRQRLLQEARAASSLDHPNIWTH